MVKETIIVVPNTYVCQYCSKEFKTDKDMRIRPQFYEPLCSQNCYDMALFTMLFRMFKNDENLELWVKKWKVYQCIPHFDPNKGEFDRKKAILALRNALKYKNYVLFRLDIRQDKKSLDIKMSKKFGQKLGHYPPLGGYVPLSNGPKSNQSNLDKFVPTIQFDDKKEGGENGLE